MSVQQQQQLVTALHTNMIPAKGFDFSAGCKTSDTLLLISTSESRFNTEDSLPEWSEVEALPQSRGLEKLKLSITAECGESQEKFEFATPPFFEDLFEEQEHIDGYHQEEVCWNITMGDFDDAKQPPADFGPAVKKHLHARLPAPQQSRYQRILAREESLDSPTCLDCTGFAAGSAAKALRQLCPRGRQEVESFSPSGSASSAGSGASDRAPPAAATVPLTPQAPASERLLGRGRRPGRQPSESLSSGSGDAEEVPRA